MLDLPVQALEHRVAQQDRSQQEWPYLFRVAGVHQRLGRWLSPCSKTTMMVVGLLW